MQKLIYLILITILVSLNSCGQSQNEVSENNSRKVIENKTLANLEYDLLRPSATYILDKELSEISSLSFDSKEKSLLTNDDESGKFHELNISNGDVLNKTKFAKRGDYEGIEFVGDKVFVLKNNGTLYSYDRNTKETTVLKNILTAKNNAEGLAYEKGNNFLLIACKGQALEEEKTKKTKAVYAFDLESKNLIKDAYLRIHDDDLLSLIQENNYSKSELKKLKRRAKDFAPSGIAIHPESNEYYVISARGSSLVIFDANKVLDRLVFLNPKIIPQPEGITFDDKQSLYISTEGQGFSGKIFRFDKISQ